LEGKTTVTHSVEELYQKISVLHEKAIELHRERYRVSGSYDETQCQYMVDDIKAFAREIERGPIDLDRDFSK
jgi:hypothetical protein